MTGLGPGNNQESQTPPWWPSDKYDTPASDTGLDFQESQTPPWWSPQRRAPSATKRKLASALDSLSETSEGDEPDESTTMQVDTSDATPEIRTTTSSVSLFFSTISLCVLTEFTSHWQTSVSVTAVEDAQPVTKKAKTLKTEDPTMLLPPGPPYTQANPTTRTPSVDSIENKKSRSEYKNCDLPIPVDHRWTTAFMDTAILWAGGQPNIWSIPDETLATALQEIFNAVYPDVQYEVTVHSAVFGVVRHGYCPHRFSCPLSLVTFH